MSAGAWRYRCCPHCGRVHRASDLESLDYGRRWGQAEPTRRRCPNCVYVGVTSDFVVVRERYAAVQPQHQLQTTGLLAGLLEGGWHGSSLLRSEHHGLS
jgi:hypothetical protein